jgi:hypothetical protein
VLQEALPFARLEPIESHGEDGCQALVLYDSRGKPVNWPNLVSNKLLIRPVFREFFERPDIFNFGKRREGDDVTFNTLVRGIPGIGKSSFALYCLWRLVTQEKRHVLYDYPKGLDDSETLEIGSGPRDEAVYIADGLKPRKVAGIRLLVTSPRQEFFEEFKKDAQSFFMPEPTDEEMLLMRDVCFSRRKDSLTDSVVLERIDRWGRVPRMVMGTEVTQQLDLSATLAGLSLEPLRRLLFNREETGSKKDVSFRLVHYGFNFDSAAPYRWVYGQAPQRDYVSITLRCASPFMQDRIWEFLYRADHHSHMDMLRDLFKDKMFVGVGSSLWESWCRVALDRGSADLPGNGFRVRRLLPATNSPAADALGHAADTLLGIAKDDDGGSLLPAPAATSVRFSSLADLESQLAAPSPADAHRRFVAPPMFASIDFWEAQLKHPCGSNATVSPSHDLIVQGERLDNGWRAVASSLGLVSRDTKQGPIIHLWLVPSVVFSQCVAGKLKFAAKKQRDEADAVDKAVRAAASGNGAAAERTRSQKEAAQAFNAAVDEALALAPRIVQYAVLVPFPQDWPKGASGQSSR